MTAMYYRVCLPIPVWWMYIMSYPQDSFIRGGLLGAYLSLKAYLLANYASRWLRSFKSLFFVSVVSNIEYTKKNNHKY